MNIVYGGSFNPPTKGHKKIIDMLFEIFKPENIILLPVSNRFNKEGLIDDNYRFQMLKLLDERIIVSDLEINKEFKGTYASLNELKKEYDDLHYVIGADNLEKLDKWIKFPNLISEYRFIVIGRENTNVLEMIETKYKKYENQFIYVEANIEGSSSQYRNTKNSDLLTKEVNEYILKNGLYKEGNK